MIFGTELTKSFATKMLPPLQNSQCRVPMSSQLSELKENISNIVKVELMTMRELIEGSVKDIDARFLKFEGRLRSVLEPRDLQSVPNNSTTDDGPNLFVSIDKNFNQLEDIGTALVLIL